MGMTCTTPDAACAVAQAHKAMQTGSIKAHKRNTMEFSDDNNNNNKNKNKNKN